MQFVAIGSLFLNTSNTCGEEKLSERRCDRTQLVGVASRGGYPIRHCRCLYDHNYICLSHDLRSIGTIKDYLSMGGEPGMLLYLFYNSQLRRFRTLGYCRAVVVVAKGFERQPCNLEAPSSNPPGFYLFYYQQQSVLNQVLL